MILFLLLTLELILITITVDQVVATIGESETLRWIIPFEFGRNSSDLCYIMNFWGSDRGHPLYRAKYSFTPYYSHIFAHHRHNHIQLLEINYRTFGSLQGWKSYFPQANVYGINAQNKQRINDHADRVDQHIQIINLASESDFNVSFFGVSFEIIIDHAQSDMTINIQHFEKSISKLSLHGFYFIEAIQSEKLSLWIKQLEQWKIRYPEKTMKILSFPEHQSINSEDNFLLVVHSPVSNLSKEHSHHHKAESNQPAYSSNDVPPLSSFSSCDPTTIKKRGQGDRNGLKVLILSSDTRALKKEYQGVQDYVSAASVLNQYYANYHQYDYIKFSANYSTVTAREAMRQEHPDVTTAEKIASDFPSFNYAFRHVRAAPWSKVPFLWYALRQYRAYYDYILFVDSDAAFNPSFLNRSISDALAEWNASDEFFAFGARDIYQSNFIFLNNFPWRDDLPCTGIILVKANDQSFQMLNDWWHYYIPGKNMQDFLEQDALWHMLESPSYHFSFNRSTVTLLLEAQLVSLAFGLNELWICHIPNYHAWNRIVNFRYLLHYADLYEEKRYLAVLGSVVEDFVDLYGVTKEMSAEFPRPLRETYPPEYSGDADMKWHVGKQYPLYRAVVYNYQVLQLHGSRNIYFCVDGVLRSFVSMDSMVAYGFDTNFVLQFSRHATFEVSIPKGPNLPTDPNDLIPNYQEFMKVGRVQRAKLYRDPEWKRRFEQLKSQYFSQQKQDRGY